MKLIFLILGLFISSFAVASGLEGSPCTATTDQITPAIGSDNHLRLDIVSECVIPGALPASSLKKLSPFQSTVIAAIQGESHVNSGPVSETYQDLPSQVLDVTDHTADDHGTLDVRRTIHIATDGESRLIYNNVSTEIKGTGDSGYLRSFISNYEIKASADNTGVVVHFENQVEIAKPWYAPSGIFMREAQRSVRLDFESNRDSLVNMMTKEIAL